MKKHITLNKLLSIIVYCIIGIFIMAHATPSLSVRTQLFLHGYIRSSFTSRIYESNEVTQAPGKIYRVTPTPANYSSAAYELARTTPLRPDSYKVKTFGLSFSEMVADD